MLAYLGTKGINCALVTPREFNSLALLQESNR